MDYEADHDPTKSCLIPLDWPAGLIQGRVLFIFYGSKCGSHSRAGLIQGRVSFKDLRYVFDIFEFFFYKRFRIETIQ